MQEQQLQPNEDQLWRAFLYVSGELSDDKADEFERQLMDDELLCEAVVEASRLTSAVADSFQTSPQRLVATDCSRRPAKNRLQGVAALVAVCCCVFAVVSAMQFSATPEQQFGYSEPTEAEQLVDAWADSFSETAPQSADHGDFAEQTLEVPDWMVVAVALDASDASDSDLNGNGVDADWF